MEARWRQQRPAGRFVDFELRAGSALRAGAGGWRWKYGMQMSWGASTWCSFESRAPTRCMFPQNICVPYVCTDQPTVRTHCTESMARQKLMRRKPESSRSQLPLESVPCSISARNLQDKTYKWRRELRFTFGSDLHSHVFHSSKGSFLFTLAS